MYFFKIKNSAEYNETTEQKEKAQEEKMKFEAKLPLLQNQQNALQTRINKIEGKKVLLDDLHKERDKIINEGITSFRLKCRISI